MSAHDQNLRANGGADATDLVSDTHAYYAVLAGRLENLLLDMKSSGTPADDPLRRRLSDLLSETRSLMQKRKPPADD